MKHRDIAGGKDKGGSIARDARKIVSANKGKPFLGRASYERKS